MSYKKSSRKQPESLYGDGCVMHGDLITASNKCGT